jgi:N-acetyl-gamma-glutamylphosphate reductase
VLLKDRLEEIFGGFIGRIRFGAVHSIVKEKAGIYRYPEPKLLAGSNYCDVGFELDAVENRWLFCRRLTT